MESWWVPLSLSKLTVNVNVNHASSDPSGWLEEQTPGVFKFHFGMGVRPEGGKLDLVERIGAKFGDLLKLFFFDSNVACRTDFGPNEAS